MIDHASIGFECIKHSLTSSRHYAYVLTSTYEHLLGAIPSNEWVQLHHAICGALAIEVIDVTTVGCYRHTSAEWMRFMDCVASNVAFDLEFVDSEVFQQASEMAESKLALGELVRSMNELQDWARD